MRMPHRDGVLAAEETIRPYLAPTPLYRYPALDALAGTEVWVKHENHQPVGAFKVRGGINLMARLAESDRRAGVIAASTGNHGQSVAYAARLFDVRARICVPYNANAIKVQAMQDMGAEVIVHGQTYDDARRHCEELATGHGLRYIHSGDEPDLIEGVGTCALELVRSRPDIEVIVVPIGGGSGAAGCCLVAKAHEYPVEVVGVQSSAAPAAYQAWRSGKPAEAPNKTFAEGLSTGTSFALPQQVLNALLDDFVLVEDDDIALCQAHLVQTTRNLIEAAGAAPLAALLRYPERFEGRRVAVIASGGNVTLDQLREVLSRYDRRDSDLPTH